MLSSKRGRRLALHPKYRDPSNEDNDSATGDREKDNNSLRLMSFSANSQATKTLLNMSVSASAVPVFEETFDMFVGNVFSLFFFIRFVVSFLLLQHSLNLS